MQNLKKNWLVVWKMKWGIWQIFTKSYDSLKTETLMASFCLKLRMYELKNYRGVVCHDNEKWYKNWIGIDLSVQNWHKEFGKFWPEHLKISKLCTLMGCFWPKYIMFEPKKSTEDLCLMVLNIDAKHEGKVTCAFKNDMAWHISAEKQSTAFFFSLSSFFFFTAHFLKNFQSILCFPMVSP